MKSCALKKNSKEVFFKCTPFLFLAFFRVGLVFQNTRAIRYAMIDTVHRVLNSCNEQFSVIWTFNWLQSCDRRRVNKLSFLSQNHMSEDPIISPTFQPLLPTGKIIMYMEKPPGETGEHLVSIEGSISLFPPWYICFSCNQQTFDLWWRQTINFSTEYLKLNKFVIEGDCIS